MNIGKKMLLLCSLSIIGVIVIGCNNTTKSTEKTTQKTTTESTTEDTMKRFSRKTTVSDKKITFQTKEVSMELPASWASKYSTDSDLKTYITFYHKKSKDLWEKDGEKETGALFTLGYCEDDSYKEFIDGGTVIGTSKDGGTYYLIEPTDVQAYVPDKAATKEYNKMADDVATIFKTAKMK